MTEIQSIPSKLNENLESREHVVEVVRAIEGHQKMFLIGRRCSYPLALEGALKLKEICYVQAEAYAAGELKHGPLALVEKGTPVIVIAPEDEVFDKTIANMIEAKTRGAKIILITNTDQNEILGLANHVMKINCKGLVEFTFSSLLALQLINYHLAKKLGVDIDRPRNLAKSVTVE